MKVIVNGQERDAQAATLAELLCELEVVGNSYVTAINSQMVPQGARREARLEEGDRIEILSPMQGG